jgi:hypothetical protein
LKSTKIDTVFEFLCLKRTESGVIVDAYEDWLKKCEMGERPRICIARHLGALGVRLEALIGATCPVFGKDRQWFSDHTIVLGGYAKDFFFEIGVHDAKAFVTETTKRLSYKLGVWRGKNGLPPLKGTGKVASISGWKAQIREAQEFELHDGQILGDDWAKSMNILKSEPSKTPPPSKKRLRKQLPLPTKKLDKTEQDSKSASSKEPTLSQVSPPENRLPYYSRQGSGKEKKPLQEPLTVST